MRGVVWKRGGLGIDGLLRRTRRIGGLWRWRCGSQTSRGQG
jgi:hypothetical protein